MKEQRITIEIDGEGKLTADAEGFSGDTCIKDLEKLLEGLASPREQVERKPDAGERRAGVARTLKMGKKG